MNVKNVVLAIALFAFFAINVFVLPPVCAILGGWAVLLDALLALVPLYYVREYAKVEKKDALVIAFLLVVTAIIYSVSGGLVDGRWLNTGVDYPSAACTDPHFRLLHVWDAGVEYVFGVRNYLTTMPVLFLAYFVSTVVVYYVSKAVVGRYAPAAVLFYALNPLIIYPLIIGEITPLAYTYAFLAFFFLFAGQPERFVVTGAVLGLIRPEYNFFIPAIYAAHLALRKEQPQPREVLTFLLLSVYVFGPVGKSIFFATYVHGWDPYTAGPYLGDKVVSFVNGIISHAVKNVPAYLLFFITNFFAYPALLLGYVALRAGRKAALPFITWLAVTAGYVFLHTGAPALDRYVCLSFIVSFSALVYLIGKTERKYSLALLAFALITLALYATGVMFVPSPGIVGEFELTFPRISKHMLDAAVACTKDMNARVCVSATLPSPCSYYSYDYPTEGKGFVVAWFEGEAAKYIEHQPERRFNFPVYHQEVPREKATCCTAGNVVACVAPLEVNE